MSLLDAVNPSYIPLWIYLYNKVENDLNDGILFPYLLSLSSTPQLKVLLVLDDPCTFYRSFSCPVILSSFSLLCPLWETSHATNEPQLWSHFTRARTVHPLGTHAHTHPQTHTPIQFADCGRLLVQLSASDDNKQRHQFGPLCPAQSCPG